MAYYPQYFSSAAVDDITREHYGTDVPHLANKIKHLEYKLQSTEQSLRRKRRENEELRHKYRTLERNYYFVWDQLDRYKAKLKEAKARLKWRY